MERTADTGIAGQNGEHNYNDVDGDVRDRYNGTHSAREIAQCTHEDSGTNDSFESDGHDARLVITEIKEISLNRRQEPSADCDDNPDVTEDQEPDVTETEPVPDGEWGWFVVVGAVIIHVYIGGFMKSSGVMYLKLKDKFDDSAMATAWVFSLFTTFLLMMGPVASAMCQRLTCRTVVLIGSVVCFIGVLVSAYAPNLQFLYFSYGLLGGFGRCLTYTPSLILVTHYFNKRRGLAVGLSTAGVGLGMFCFPPLIDFLFSTYGYQGAMMMLAAVGLQSFVCSALFRPLSTHYKLQKINRINRLLKQARRGSVDARQEVRALTKPPRKSALNGVAGVDKLYGSSIFSSTTEFTVAITPPAPSPRRKSIFQEGFHKIKQSMTNKDNTGKKPPLFEVSLLKDFPFLSLCLAILLFTMSMMSTFVFLPPLAKSRGVSDSQAALLVSVIGACDSVSRFASGFILDMKRVKQYRVLVYNAVMIGVGVVSMIMPSIHGFVGFAVISGCYGVLCGAYVAQKSVVVVDILGLEKMASSFGMVLAFQGVGSLIGPTIAGLFRDVFGTYDEAFYFGGIGIFCGGLVLACGNAWKIFRDRRNARRAQRTTSNGDVSA